MSAEPEEYQTVKYFLLWGGVVTPRSPEQALSAEASSEVNEYRGMTIYVYQYISLLVVIYIFIIVIKFRENHSHFIYIEVFCFGRIFYMPSSGSVHFYLYIFFPHVHISSVERLQTFSNHGLT